MREDMRHVLIDRPRWGSHRRHPKRAAQRRWDEDSPARQSMSRHRGGSRSLSDHLGPLKRFLTARTGLPWDEVYAEICAAIDPRSTLERHILEHLHHMVAQDVVIRGGEVFPPPSMWRRPLHGNWRNCFYVEPRTGLLRAAPLAPRG